MGAVGLMQVIPRFHADKLEGSDPAAYIEPRTNIDVGARILKEYITRGGTEADGLQMYNGATDDPAKSYANKVIGERDRLRQVVARPGKRAA
jgi:soluble lytic murein transglycosylase-like protein